MATLLHSAAFWTAFIDALIRLVNILGERYWPNQVKLINDLWLAVQPVVLIVMSVFLTNELIVPAVMAALP